jgi:type VI secretion system secreted protein VgrG
MKGFDTNLQLGGRYEPREYCVQCRETDFDFARRLMEERGSFILRA